MNPSFGQLQSYPFQKLAALTGAVTPPPELKRISLHIGEPKHPTPEFIKRALTENLGGRTGGSDEVAYVALRSGSTVADQLLSCRGQHRAT